MTADSGNYTVLASPDLSSDFDTVDHKILINKLKNHIGLSASVLEWFSSYVSVNRIMFKTTRLTCGVPQGSVLGHFFLFSVFFPLGTINTGLETIIYN